MNLLPILNKPFLYCGYKTSGNRYRMKFELFFKDPHDKTLQKTT